MVSAVCAGGPAAGLLLVPPDQRDRRPRGYCPQPAQQVLLSGLAEAVEGRFSTYVARALTGRRGAARATRFHDVPPGVWDVGAGYSVHLMRPGHTRGSAHRVDPAARPSQLARRQLLLRHARVAAPVPRNDADGPGCRVGALGQHPAQPATPKDEHSAQQLTTHGPEPTVAVTCPPT